MPRCSCGAATCACSVIAGDGIEVSGVGTQANPYQITNQRGNALERLQVVDTDSVDLTLTALVPDDPNTPYTLQADSTVSMLDLSDVNGDDFPVTGDTPVWDGTQWQFQPAAVALPPGGTAGQVLTKQSATNGDATWAAVPTELPAGGTDGQVLTKSGGANAWAAVPHELPVGGSTGQALVKSSATDYAVNWATLAAALAPSGVWGTAPLNIYGADSLVGREIYVDSASQIRAKPLVFDRASSSITATTPPSGYPRGISVMRVIAADNGAGSGWPDNGTFGHVETQVERDQATAVQIWRRDTSTPNAQAVYQRTYAAGVCWPWQDISVWADYCILAANAAQSMATSAETIITFAAATSTDPLGLWNGSDVVTVRRDGVYEIVVGYSFAGVAGATGSRIALFRINGLSTGSWALPVVVSPLTGSVTDIRTLNANDTIQMRQYQSQGASLNTYNQAYPSLKVVRLGPKIT